jgi:hypothetical protein
MKFLRRYLDEKEPTLKSSSFEQGIEGLDRNWRGDVFVPDEFLPLVAAV